MHLPRRNELRGGSVLFSIHRTVHQVVSPATLTLTYVHVALTAALYIRDDSSWRLSVYGCYVGDTQCCSSV